MAQNRLNQNSVSTALWHGFVSIAADLPARRDPARHPNGWKLLLPLLAHFHT